MRDDVAICCQLVTYWSGLEVVPQWMCVCTTCPSVIGCPTIYLMLLLGLQVLFLV
jgi:hypothetical protein